MKRYLLFAGDQYYPAGGWQDYKGRFNRISEALKAAANGTWSWWQVVDLKSDKIVEEGVR